MNDIEADALQHGVASARFKLMGRAKASAGIAAATAGHAGTFLALTAGTLWLAVTGDQSLPLVKNVFVTGLYLQVLPALGFALVARHLSAYGRPLYAAGAGALSLASMSLLAVGALQLVDPGGLQIFFLAAAVILIVAVGTGILVSRVVHAFKDGFEDESPYVIETPDPQAPLHVLP